MHKTRNVLNCLPKKLHPEATDSLHQIWMAKTRKDAEKAFDAFKSSFNDYEFCVAVAHRQPHQAHVVAQRNVNAAQRGAMGIPFSIDGSLQNPRAAPTQNKPKLMTGDDTPYDGSGQAYRSIWESTRSTTRSK